MDGIWSRDGGPELPGQRLSIYLGSDHPGIIVYRNDRNTIPTDNFERAPVSLRR